MLNTADPELQRLQQKLSEVTHDLALARAIKRAGGLHVIDAENTVVRPSGMTEEEYLRALERVRMMTRGSIHFHIEGLEMDDWNYRRLIAQHTAVIWAVLVDLGDRSRDPWLYSSMERFISLREPHVMALSMHVEVFFHDLGLRLSDDGELLIRSGRDEETQLAVHHNQTKFVTYDGHVWLSTAPARELAEMIGREQVEELRRETEYSAQEDADWRRFDGLPPEKPYRPFTIDADDID